MKKYFLFCLTLLCLNSVVNAQLYVDEYEPKYIGGPLIDSIGTVYSEEIFYSSNIENGIEVFDYKIITNKLSGKVIDSVNLIEPIYRFHSTEIVNNKDKEKIANNIFYETGNYIIKRNQKTLVVDIKFNILLNDIFDNYECIGKRNIYLIYRNNKVGVLSTSGELKLKPEFDEIVDLRYRNNEMYKNINYVKKDELMGITDSNFNLKILPIYNKIETTYKKNKLLATKKDTCSIINLDDFSIHGKVKSNGLWDVTLTPKGSERKLFFTTQYGDHDGLLDSNLNLISDTNFNSIVPLPNTNYFKVGKVREWAYTDLNYNYGLLDKKNKLCISCNYDDISSFENGFFKVVKNKRIGVVDQNFKEVISPQFFEMSSLGSKYFAFKRGEFLGIINLSSI